MNTWELFIIAIGLSMDAFAVSICKGLSVQKEDFRNNIIVGIYFGGFQAIMPFLGYLLCTRFSSLITSVDHWVAFVLLLIIGGKMVVDSRDISRPLNSSFGIKAMFPLAVATSIDALAIGITFAFLDVQIIPAITIIGAVTFVFSVVGVKIGTVFGSRFKSKAEFMGGIILILMGTRILLEHLNLF